MRKYDWYKRYPAKFISGTVGWTLELKGAYSILLDLIYDGGGSCPDDARWIANILGIEVTTRRWNIIRQKLIELGKLEVRDGRLFNPAATRMLASEQDLSTLKTSSRRAGDAVSGQDKSNFLPPKKISENEATLFKDKDLAQFQHGPRQGVPARTRESQSQNKSQTRPVDVVVQVQKIADALAQKPGKYWATDYTRMIDADGLSFEDILAAAKQHKANGREPLRSISGLRSLAAKMRDHGAGTSQAQPDYQSPDTLTDDEWVEALDCLLRSGIWNQAKYGGLPSTPSYCGPKDHEAQFIDRWVKQGRHPRDEICKDLHWHTYPADNPDPIVRAYWAPIK